MTTRPTLPSTNRAPDEAVTYWGRCSRCDGPVTHRSGTWRHDTMTERLRTDWHDPAPVRVTARQPRR